MKQILEIKGRIINPYINSNFGYHMHHTLTVTNKRLDYLGESLNCAVHMRLYFYINRLV